MFESILSTLQIMGACSGTGSFLGFPTWDKYLSSETFQQWVNDSEQITVCQPQLNGINDVWLVVAAIIEILLRVGAIVSVGFIIWGAIQLIVSQGDPNGIKSGRETIINAITGLIICVMAAVLVNFVAGRFN